MHSTAWSQVKDVLEGLAALIVILGVPPIAARQAIRLWASTLGRRRAQARLLDQLACGEPLARVNTWLGLPVHTEGNAHTYELPAAWIQIVASGGVVVAFAVTIRSRWMFYDTRRLSGGNLRARLGRSTFKGNRTASLYPAYADGDRCVGYAETYTFVGGGYNQWYALGYNKAGVGDLKVSGQLSEDPDRIECARALQDTTMNTLVVYAPTSTTSETPAVYVGVDPLHVRTRLSRG